MSITPESCRDENRRAEVRGLRGPGEPALNGIDYIDVGEDHRALTIHFLHEAPRGITQANVRVDGGRRITGIVVLPFKVAEPQRDARPSRQLTIRVDREGDFSPYTLRLVEPDAHGKPGEAPLAGLDPYYASAEFSFKVDCPTDLDCGPTAGCPPTVAAEPEIDYLAKDYGGFRQLALDRLSQIAPDWRERHAADLGITLVEVLAYVGDHLSYLQDAVATEAYLGTARQRISVRRHVKLVDYAMHEGCNARTWLCIQAIDTQDGPDVPAIDLGGLQFTTGGPPGSRVVFEPLAPRSIKLRASNNRIRFYTWENRECCLPRGATSATVWGGPAPRPKADVPPSPPAPAPPQGQHTKHEHSEAHQKGGHHETRGAGTHPSAQKPEYGPPKPPPPPPAVEPGAASLPLFLEPGDVLVFEEVMGPKTGNMADADPRHRHAVRLTSVERLIDPLKNTQVYEVGWADEDRLPFTLCLSTLGKPPRCDLMDDVSVAHGNVVLIDQGGTVEEQLTVPDAPPAEDRCTAVGHPEEVEPPIARIPPQILSGSPITHSVAYPTRKSVARRQAQQLAGLMEQVYAVVPKILARVKKEKTPLTVDEQARLSTLFAAEDLADLGLVDPATGAVVSPPTRALIAALNCLIGRQVRLLVKKAHRVRVLLEYARSGYIVAESEGREIGEMFGIDFASGLAPDNPRWLDPASASMTQDPAAAVPAISLQEVEPGTLPVGRPTICTDTGDRVSVAASQAKALAEIRASIHQARGPLLDSVRAGGLPLAETALAEVGSLLRPEALGRLGLAELDEAAPPDRSGDPALVERRLSGRFDRIDALEGFVREGFLLTPDEVREIRETFSAGAEIADVPPDTPAGLWCPRADLLSSQALDPHFVAEFDDDGRAHLRFGDGDLGRVPAPATTFRAAYRVGNGIAGNVAAGVITRFAPRPGESDPSGGVVVGVRNPLPAVGGIAPEPVAEAKLYAPGAFRSQRRRAITIDDYASFAGAVPGVQRAAATLRMPGGLREIQVAIDPLGTEDPSDELIAEVRAALEPYRRIGHDLRVVAARYIPLDVALTVDVLPRYLRGHVEADLGRVFSNGVNPDGSRGLFHPDNLTFGQDIELSRLVASAQAVTGVQSATVSRLRRRGDRAPKSGPDPAIVAGLLKLGPLEIPRLDNDPSFPEHGVFNLTMRGGR